MEKKSIIKTADIVNHPEGGILLLDGSVINGYSLEQPVEKPDNSMRLDTTGVYLNLGKKKPVEKKPEREEEIKLFLKNAWYFYEHYKDICADSRKFLAYVPIQSGIAYMGGSGFRHPTLGVYVEWWHFCDSAVVELKGEKWLVWHIAGSPMSGMNRCSLVNAEGKSQTCSIDHFSFTWSSFVRVNTRYDECKSKYQAYTLEEVVDLMCGDDDENIFPRKSISTVGRALN